MISSFSELSAGLACRLSSWTASCLPLRRKRAHATLPAVKIHPKARLQRAPMQMFTGPWPVVIPRANQKPKSKSAKINDSILATHWTSKARSPKSVSVMMAIMQQLSA